MAEGFKSLLAVHRGLDDLFFEHQRALLRLELERSATLLSTYETNLLVHMRDEEELMIPLYRERVDAPVGGAAEIYLGEHNKLRQFIVLFKEKLATIVPDGNLEREILFLLDSQHLFKRLLVHHDSRERKFLYPLLEETTSERERERLFRRMGLPTLKVAPAEPAARLESARCH